MHRLAIKNKKKLSKRIKMEFSLVDILGWIGGIEVLIAYGLISTKRVDQSSLFYHLLNLTGALLLIMNTIYKGAYPSAFVNVVWVGIAVYSIWKYSIRKRPNR
jgi:hypothetical protein